MASILGNKMYSNGEKSMPENHARSALTEAVFYILLSVYHQPLHAAAKIIFCPAAGGNGNVVPILQKLAHQMHAGKTGSAQYQDIQPSSLFSQGFLH